MPYKQQSSEAIYGMKINLKRDKITGLMTERKSLKIKIASYFSLAMSVVFICFENFVVERWPYPHVKAEIYVAPRGCLVRKYKELDNISNSCRDNKYKLSYIYFLSHHLNNGGARGEFYRVGNDVVKIGYSIFDGSCDVNDVTHDVYYQ